MSESSAPKVEVRIEVRLDELLKLHRTVGELKGALDAAVMYLASGDYKERDAVARKLKGLLKKLKEEDGE